jgi:hypothetical protein
MEEGGYNTEEGRNSEEREERMKAMKQERSDERRILIGNPSDNHQLTKDEYV